MKFYCCYFFLFLLLSCNVTKPKIVTREHGECNITTLNFDNEKNDTSRLKFINSVVFDTTANLVHGQITDRLLRPIQNCDVTLFNSEQKFTLLTNNNGEFEIFKNFLGGSWNILVKHQNYICLYVINVVQTGGQWFLIKLEPK